MRRLFDHIKNYRVYGAVLAFLLLCSACSIFQQTSEMKNFGKCEFKLVSVNNMKLAGVSIQEKGAASDLGILEYARITSAIARGELPMTFDLLIAARNPNDGNAAMNKLDWILYIDKIEMTRGVLNERIEIPAKSIASFPVSMNIDLMRSLSGESGEALLNFAFNLSGSGNNPSQIMLKGKPTIMIGSNPIEYPGYITIKQEFGAME